MQKKYCFYLYSHSLNGKLIMKIILFKKQKKKKQKRFVKVIKINLRRAILLCLLVKKKQFLEYNTYQPVGNALTYTRREPVVNENEIGKQIFLADNKTL